MKSRNCRLTVAIIAVALTPSQGVAQSIYTPYTFTTLAGIPPASAGPGSADGTGSEARFNRPAGVAIDSAGSVYVADFWNNTIRKVTPAGGVTTLAGLANSEGNADGTGNAARFNKPAGVAVDSAGNVYVADTYNQTIRKVTPAGVVTTLAGGSAARFYNPSGIAVDSAGNIYVGDFNNHTIRKVTLVGTSWVVTTLAGQAGSLGSTDGTGIAARFYDPSGVTVDSAGDVYVADYGNHSIRKVTSTGAVSTLAGAAASVGNADGTGIAARFNGASGVAVDSTGNVYVADTFNSTIRRVTPAGVVTTLAGLAGSTGSADGTGIAARFYYPPSVAVDTAGNVYVADTSNHTIRKVTPAGEVTTLAGLALTPGRTDGTGVAGRFWYPYGVAADSTSNVYVADTVNSTIRKVTPAGVVTTLAGLPGATASVDGTGSAARFYQPRGVAVDGAGNVYVADTHNNTIRKVTPAGEVTTLAGQAGSFGSVDGLGSDARFYSPYGVAVDTTGNVYVADAGNATIRKVTPAGVVTTLAGQGVGGVAVDSAGNVYVTSNNMIRKGYAAPVEFLLFGPRLSFNGGRSDLILTGPTGRLVVVEASTDLLSWLPLWTNTFAGALNFGDSQSATYVNRFYRARLQ